MGFFDEDNKSFEFTLGVIAFILSAYIVSYSVIRSGNTQIEERDGCPIEGCTVVSLRSGSFYTFYKPLIHLDMATEPGEFRFTR